MLSALGFTRSQVRKRLEVTSLRRRLVLLDSLALVLAWLPSLVWKRAEGMHPGKLLATEVVLLASGVLMFRLQGLYLARVASSRAEEIRRIFRVVIALGLVQAGLLWLLSVYLPVQWLVVGPAVLMVLLLWFRGGYRAWLSTARARGEHLRDVVVVGTNADARELVEMLTEHPEAGFRVVGVVGERSEAGVHRLGPLYLGRADELSHELERLGVLGVIIVAGALPATTMMPMVERLEADGVRIQLSNGLHGMSHRRLRATPVAYQSLYYLEPSEPHSVQMVCKRVIDVVLASFTLLVALPVMAAVALAIKATDGGPVLFGQTRVGRGGTHFRVLKFRSMVVNAEAQLAALKAEAGNQRNGPLFKLEGDPRVTRIGRFIRATSIDELPQLFNVLRGEMSIVGPRPALPSEVEHFDLRLLDRLNMPPGITGLWQVEARDNPHFGAYRRLDLFYVDNWSLNLDLVILVATVDQVLSKAWRTVLRRQPEVAPTLLQLDRTDRTDRSGTAVAGDAGEQVSRPA